MRPYIEELAKKADTFICVYPNAGLPNPMSDTGFDETPEVTSTLLAEFARAGFVNIAGGCCGTTPEHIAAIAQAIDAMPPRQVPERPSALRLSGLEAFKTIVTVEKPKVIITRNQSPDISFDRSINPYRGCEHGCVYCFARPTHAYMGLSAGLDFETRLFAKHGAGALLERELSAPGYQPRMIAIGTNTDPYQPIEREHRVMREVLEVLAKANHPVGIVTKSALVLRDLDLLAPMAAKGLVKVALSVTTLDAQLARRMEPRAATPAKRLDALRQLSEAGVPTMVMVAPIVPALNDAEIEDILDCAQTAGVQEAGYSC
jgi:DNA repair photolyase